MVKAQVTIPENVLQVLDACRVESGVLMLPPEQLERKLYEAVNKHLELMGGKWNRKAKGHVFEKDPSAILESALRTGEILDTKKAFQMFFTPPDLARRMVDVAKVQPGRRVLEPSAGAGNLVAAIINRGFLGFECGGKVVAVELNRGLANELIVRRNKTLYANDANYDVQCLDFLECVPDQLGSFHAVVMNPPFANGQDVAHIIHAMKFLKAGGWLAAICADGVRQNDKLKPLIKAMGGDWEPLPSGSFQASGTGVNTVLVSLQVKAEYLPEIQSLKERG